MIYFLVEMNMENQANVSDQNMQQIGQNPVGQHLPIPEKSRINYWMISTIVLFIGLVLSGVYILKSKNKLIKLSNLPPVSNNEPSSVATPSPTPSYPILERVNTPQTNTLYLGTHNGKEAVFLLTEQKANTNIGWLQMSESGADTAFDFEKLQNPKKIFSSNNKIHSVNSFLLNKSKTIAYVVLNYGVDTNGLQPDLMNTIIQIKLDTLITNEIWSNDIGSKKYEGAGGAAHMDTAVEDKFITFWIANCYACEGAPAGTIIINVGTKREKYFQNIGNIQFNIANNTFSYQKLAPLQESCEPSPGCKNGQRNVMKPAGQTYTENLP